MNAEEEMRDEKLCRAMQGRAGPCRAVQGYVGLCRAIYDINSNLFVNIPLNFIAITISVLLVA